MGQSISTMIGGYRANLGKHLWLAVLLIAGWGLDGMFFHGVSFAPRGACADIPYRPPVLGPLRVGIGPILRVGFETAVHIPCRLGSTANEPQTLIIELEILDGDDAPLIVRSPPTMLQPRESTTIRMLVKLGRQPLKITARAIDAEVAVVNSPNERGGGGTRPFTNQTLATQTLATQTWTPPPNSILRNSQQAYWLEIGGTSILTDLAKELWGRARHDPLISVPLTDLGNLPENGLAYSGCTGIMLTVRLDQANQQLTELQANALRHWVAGGGQLLLCVSAVPARGGTSSLEIVKNHSFSTLLPGEIRQIVPFRKFTAWESYLNAEEPIPVTEATPSLLVPVWRDMRGSTLLASDGVPLIIDEAVGLGRIRTCIIDFSQEPWVNWHASRKKLLQELLPWPLTAEVDSGNYVGNQVARLGYDDLAGQFRTALQQFDGQQVDSGRFWWIFLLAGLSALFWLILWRLRERMSVWLIWGAVFLQSAGLGWLFAATDYAPIGQSPRANVAEIVDIDSSTGWVQSQAWGAIYSENAAEINLRAFPKLKELLEQQCVACQLDWFGIPGTSWGGLDSQLASTSLIAEPANLWNPPVLSLTPLVGANYHASLPRAPIVCAPPGLRHFTLPAQFSRCFTVLGQWQGDAALPPPLQKRPNESGLRGTIHNDLHISLDDCWLLHDQWAMPLGRLEPGKLVALDELAGTGMSVGSQVAGKSNIRGGSQLQQYPREQASVPQILKMLAFHRAAGGTRYSGLWNRYLSQLDQSEKLRKHAVVIGWGPAAWHLRQTELREASGTQMDSSVFEGKGLQVEAQQTLYRIWLPVEKLDTSTSLDNSPPATATPAAGARPTTLRWPGPPPQPAK
ncbi:MAG: hypothetical protein SFX18_06300 [Pirellulales bacterium]|nr:hypothetical protein [Pirellulales bacterium]